MQKKTFKLDIQEKTDKLNLEDLRNQAFEKEGVKMVFFIPADLSNLINQVIAKHKELYQIRPGKWQPGYGKLTKYEVMLSLCLNGAYHYFAEKAEELHSYEQELINL